MLISDELFDAYLKCKTKAQLTFGLAGTDEPSHAISDWQRRLAENYEADCRDRLQAAEKENYLVGSPRPEDLRSANMTSAIIAAHVPGDMFTGLAIATVGSQTFLYAADAAHNKADVFDSNFKLLSSTDPHTPAGLAVYGIQTIHGSNYITLGAFGSTAGAVDVYNPSTKMLKRLITNAAGGALNLPWGLAISPSDFGPFSNALLVGNTGDGRINAFNSSTGKFLGTLKNSAGKIIVLSGLRAL